ncbi:unnamed protein product [Echinostoma caproni]|uniref:Endoplasmic reticulum transmembrane protein n=1 Tax=Echinostoma caproni TaxID=27848 RepID=A0A183BGR4_9TREM|nr:unnamed protein product [Echinostoma caproni]
MSWRLTPFAVLVSFGLSLINFLLSRLIASKLSSTRVEDKCSATEDVPPKEVPPSEELLSIKAENEKLLHARAELEDKYKRALAESENMRKRLMRQIEEAKIFGIQSFCKDLLDVADVLTKATEVTPQEQGEGKDSAFSNLYEGLKMTEDRSTLDSGTFQSKLLDHDNLHTPGWLLPHFGGRQLCCRPAQYHTYRGLMWFTTPSPLAQVTGFHH